MKSKIILDLTLMIAIWDYTKAIDTLTRDLFPMSKILNWFKVDFYVVTPIAI